MDLEQRMIYESNALRENYIEFGLTNLAVMGVTSPILKSAGNYVIDFFSKLDYQNLTGDDVTKGVALGIASLGVAVLYAGLVFVTINDFIYGIRGNGSKND